MARISIDEAGSVNLLAFLDMLAVSELGKGLTSSSDAGYNILVGGSTFTGYTEHPDRLINLPNLGIKSSAAGRYQFLKKTWDWARDSEGLSSFAPRNQDRAALFLIDYRGGTEAIRYGDIRLALEKCRKEWASLPGAGYGQNEHSVDHLISAYLEAGGHLNGETNDWYSNVVKK
ncbi:muramidase (phage lysozyme) [Kushneria sinocarnis]|uniref:Muramidase (Phage lysozyme) n=1 Tax=Kushneria sinocarnis TaxID=595502 RepID=A0A420WUN6_9GAMM|nr:glycoside hydrolase family 104 protein [Kushneria sinocarnis]RKQ97132.1 muramidase (phage lysozyme) [Kushneria sinocarnis]